MNLLGLLCCGGALRTFQPIACPPNFVSDNDWGVTSKQDLVIDWLGANCELLLHWRLKGALVFLHPWTSHELPWMMAYTWWFVSDAVGCILAPLNIPRTTWIMAYTWWFVPDAVAYLTPLWLQATVAKTDKWSRYVCHKAAWNDSMRQKIVIFFFLVTTFLLLLYGIIYSHYYML